MARGDGAHRLIGPSRSSRQIRRALERELEEARIITAGRSNAEIPALRLMSEWTVKDHLASIPSKHGLETGAHVVVAAYESGPGRVRRAR